MRLLAVCVLTLVTPAAAETAFASARSYRIVRIPIAPRSTNAMGGGTAERNGGMSTPTITPRAQASTLR